MNTSTSASVPDAECTHEAFERFGRDAHRFHIGWRFNDAPQAERGSPDTDLFRACDAINGCNAIFSVLRANESARGEGAHVLTELHASALQDGLHALLGYVGDFLESRYEKAVGR